MKTTTEPQGPSLFKRMVFLTGARGFRELLGAVFYILLARKSTVLFGEFMLALGMGYLLRIAADFGLNQFLVPRLGRKETDTTHLLVQVSLLKAALFMVAWTAGLVFLFSQDYTVQLRRVMILITAGVGLEAFSNTFFVVLQVRGRQKTEGLVRSAASFLGFGWGIATLAAGLSAPVIASFKLVETAILLAFAGCMMFREHRPRLTSQTMAGLALILPQVLIFGLIDIFSVAFAKINLFFLQHHGGSHDVAQYSAPWEIVDGTTILVLELILQGVLYPVFARLWLRDREQAVEIAQNSFRWLMAAALVISAVLYLESDRLIPGIYGPNYPDAVWLQHVLVLTAALSFLQYLCAFLMMSMGQEKRLLLYLLVVLLFNILCCMVLIPRSPLQGAAWSIVATKAVVAALTVFHCHAEMRLIPWRSLALLGAACASGAFLFLACRGWASRELAELSAVMPVIVLAGFWWRGQRRSTVRAGTEQF
ncbi:MAG: polysaccharide biosynthesis C-terminal domain-containing protein [Deltaproteobacteria bacterium]|nr:polysaccharide biosynthesis C-terminal domain-containing protein [Deltaproteobacteria bacterium]